MKLSKYVTLEEATKSQTATRKGLDNQPNEDQILAMKHVAKNIFDKVREFVGVPLIVSSFFRGPALNKAIGGSPTSQHCLGEAIDIDHPTLNKKVFNYIKDNLEFDQLINEFPDEKGNPSWVHVSLRRDGKNRKQILKAYSLNGKTKYEPYK